MEEPPLFAAPDLEDDPGWTGTSDTFSPSFAVHDSTGTETWADFMKWDPSNNNPQDDSLNPDADLSLDSVTDGVLDDQLFGSGVSTSDPHNVFAFGDDARNESAFDFAFNALTSAQDVARPTQASNSQTVGNDEFPSISPSALKVDTFALSGYPPHPPTISSARTSIDHSNRSPTSTVDTQVTPPSSTSEQGSPEPVRQSNTRKRKSTGGPTTSEKPPRKNAKGAPIKKTSHNMIEKRYRNKLNDKIEELKSSVPSLKRLSAAASNDDDDDDDDLDGLAPAHKTNKATILAKATEYIKHLEKKVKQQQDEMKAVKEEVERYRKLELSAPMPFTQTVATPSSSQYKQDPFAPDPAPSTPRSQEVVGAQGMIPVPDEILNLQTSGAPGPHYGNRYVSHAYQNMPRSQARSSQQPQRPTVQGRGGSGPFNKFMVGALAGLMILEGVSEHETAEENSESRGLSAFPLPALRLLRRSSPSIRYGPEHSFSFYSVFRSILLVTAVVYLVYPLFIAALTPKSKRRASVATRTIPTISLASPVELRQKAWLTASQGIWIPHHNLLYELAAIGLTAYKFTMRHTLGDQAYMLFTRTTEEEEEARIKTWKIALDAQLTGGDVEISAPRLILTLFASGTLPPTPATLMLKALHTRILLWRFAKLGFAGWSLFDMFCAMMSRRYWNKARNQLRKDLLLDNQCETERMPEHLASLLQLDCLDVLLDPVVQRAYNLAWNRPIAENTEPETTMDAVVEDFAITSPLDALAAWYSTYTLDKALVSILSSSDSVTSKIAEEDVQEALRVAPPNATAHTRALVSNSLLLDHDRRASMLAAVDSISAAEPNLERTTTIVTNSIGVTPVPQDVKVALMLAKCHDLLSASYADQAVEKQATERSVRMLVDYNYNIVNASGWTLLSFVAGYKTLNALVVRSRNYSPQAPKVKETLAGSLRLFVGKEEGRSLGLSKKARARVVERCLALRAAAGEEKSDKESGYGSAELNG